MGTWKAHIESLKEKYIGKKVKYDKTIYTIVDVDYNGVILIDRPAHYTDTTAAYMDYEVEKYLVK